MLIHDLPTTGNLLPTTAPHDAADGGGNGACTTAVSTRKRAANQANGRKSHGPVTPEGKLRSSQNARKPLERLLGLAEARTLRHEPGAALKLYRELIAPYQPAPALHFQDLARLYLELEACESIRDALLDHRAQQNTIEVRARYREMDAELDVAPQEVFERGLYDLPDSPAKLKKQLDGLDLLKQKLEQRAFDSLGPALRQLYGNELNPKSERGKLICIDCQRLMDRDPSGGEPISDQELHELVFLIEQEEQYADEGYELELDKRTVTGSASVSFLAPRRKDQWLYLQAQRLRQAIDRKQWVITGLLQTPMMARRYGAKALEEAQENGHSPAGGQLRSAAGNQPAAGAGGRPGGRARYPARGQTPRGYRRKAKTNPRSAVESTKAPKNEPKTNPNEPRTNPSPSASAQPKSCVISGRCGRVRRVSRACCSSGGCCTPARRAVEAVSVRNYLPGVACSLGPASPLTRLRDEAPDSSRWSARLQRGQARRFAPPSSQYGVKISTMVMLNEVKHPCIFTEKKYGHPSRSLTRARAAFGVNSKDSPLV